MTKLNLENININSNVTMLIKLYETTNKISIRRGVRQDDII